MKCVVLPLRLLASVLCVWLAAVPAFAQDEDPAHAQLRAMRDDLLDAVNKRDIDRVLRHLHPDVVVTWQNAEVSRKPDGVRAYLSRMLEGPNSIVRSFRHVGGGRRTDYSARRRHRCGVRDFQGSVRVARRAYVRAHQPMECGAGAARRRVEDRIVPLVDEPLRQPALERRAAAADSRRRRRGAGRDLAGFFVGRARGRRT